MLENVEALLKYAEIYFNSSCREDEMTKVNKRRKEQKKELEEDYEEQDDKRRGNRKTGPDTKGSLLVQKR